MKQKTNPKPSNEREQREEEEDDARREEEVNKCAFFNRANARIVPSDSAVGYRIVRLFSDGWNHCRTTRTKIICYTCVRWLVFPSFQFVGIVEISETGRERQRQRDREKSTTIYCQSLARQRQIWAVTWVESESHSVTTDSHELVHTNTHARVRCVCVPCTVIHSYTQHTHFTACNKIPFFSFLCFSFLGIGLIAFASFSFQNFSREDDFHSVTLVLSLCTTL